LTTSGVRSVARWRGLLMAAEIAAALTLAVGAGLLVRSLMRLSVVDLGFEPQNVLLFTVNPPDTKYRDDAARVAFLQEIERRVASIPGVASAALANEFPLRGGGQSRVTLSGDVTVGTDCWVRPDATIKRSILLPGSMVGDGAYLEDCIVGHGYNVRPGETIRGGALIRRS
jgi:hypothetical protein